MWKILEDVDLNIFTEGAKTTGKFYGIVQEWIQGTSLFDKQRILESHIGLSHDWIIWKSIFSYPSWISTTDQIL